jgi:hypothetical protein
MKEEFVEGFMGVDSITPIDIVSEVTGLSLSEIRKSNKVIIWTNTEDGFREKEK